MIPGYRHECMVLSSQLHILHRRAGQAAGTIRVHKCANATVTHATKERISLAAPSVIVDWEVMSMLPSKSLFKNSRTLPAGVP